MYHKAFGWKDMENQVPASADDYYILFSQTKAVTTVAFMTLVEKGLVAIDDPVSKSEGSIGLNGPIEDYAKFCQMMLNKGTFNGRRILKPETVELMTTINRLPEENAGGEGFQFGLGFELYNEQKKPVPEVSNTAYAWGGLYRTSYIIDPENDMIALFYLNMPRHEPVYSLLLSKAYELFGDRLKPVKL